MSIVYGVELPTEILPLQVFVFGLVVCHHKTHKTRFKCIVGLVSDKYYRIIDFDSNFFAVVKGNMFLFRQKLAKSLYFDVRRKNVSPAENFEIITITIFVFFWRVVIIIGHLHITISKNIIGVVDILYFTNINFIYDFFVKHN